MNLATRESGLFHTQSCPAWRNEHGVEVHRTDCTCGLRYRIELSTERTMHAAWRKRAEEAEAENTALRARVAALEGALRESEDAVKLDDKTREASRAVSDAITYAQNGGWTGATLDLSTLHLLFAVLDHYSKSENVTTRMMDAWLVTESGPSHEFTAMIAAIKDPTP